MDELKRLSCAIVCPPARNFSEGLTTAGLGAPSYERALEQHARYCEALERCGLTLTRLDADPRYPDSTFVEDTAVIAGKGALLCRPGARSREGEVERVRGVLEQILGLVHVVAHPGTLDGGDVCEAEGHFLIGISQRTNEEGAAQLAAFLSAGGYGSTFVDIRGVAGLLHLKSGAAYLGSGRMALAGALVNEEGFRGLETVRVPESEAYAANCVRVNERVLLAAGYPRTEDLLRQAGYSVLTLDMSEFRKMDGGLSCLSLRF